MALVRFLFFWLCVLTLTPVSYARDSEARSAFKDTFEIVVKGDAKQVRLLDFIPMHTGMGDSSLDTHAVPTHKRVAAFDVSSQGYGSWSLHMIVGRNSQEYCQFTIEDSYFLAAPVLQDTHCSAGWQVSGPIGHGSLYQVTIKIDKK